MPGDKYASIQHPRMYRALRRRGFSKEAAARISNARTPGHRVKDLLPIVRFPDESLRDAIVHHLSLDIEEEQQLDDLLEQITGEPNRYEARKESGTSGLAIPPTGPHALFNQPGVGIRSSRRRKRLKGWDAKVGQTIIGNLVRGEGGRFSGGSGSSASRKPSARSDRSKQRQARADERRARYAAEDDQEQTTRAEEDAYIAAGATGRERQQRRAEIAAKRRERANIRRARRAEDAAMGREQRGEEDAADAKTEEEAKPKGGGGGGGKKKPTEEEKRAESDRKKAENRAKTAPQAGLSGAEAEFLAGAASGTLPPGSFDAGKLRALGLVVDTGDTTEATDAGRRALAAMERGDVRAALAAIQDGKAQVAHDAAKRERDQRRQQPKKPLPAPGAPGKKPGQGSPGQRVPGQRPTPRPPVSTMPVRPDPSAERERNQDLARRIIRNLEERRQRRSRSRNRGIGGITNVERSNRSQRKEAATFTVFKDAAGHDRWASITTTAYQDKDQEWISRKAIRAVVAAGDSGAPRGPLRFWHVPGLDLGDCDYQATLDDGRMLLESGTFRSKAAARVGQEAARRGYQMSPGFVHTRQEPRGGVFDQIALFERSFVPPGRASNPYTRLLTKETRMLTPEKRKEFEQLAGDDEGRALLTQLLTQAETTTKAADQAGAIYKEAPAWAQALVAEIQGFSERLKAIETKAPMPAAEMMEAGDTEADDGLAELEAETMADGPGDLLDDNGFADLIVQKLVTVLGPLLELEKKMAGWASEIKAGLPQMQQQMAQKDDARAKEIEALRTANTALETRLKALEGDQPRAARNLVAGVWGDLTGISVTKEQAAALATQQSGQQVPADLEPQYHDAYRVLWGNE